MIWILDGLVISTNPFLMKPLFSEGGRTLGGLVDWLKTFEMDSWISLPSGMGEAEA